MSAVHMLSVTLVLLNVVLGQQTGQETAQQNGQQPNVGSAGQQTRDECTSFRIDLARYTKFFYTCCGEMRVDNPSTGNEEMVQNWDCNPSYISYAPVNITQKFNCNGETGATAIRAICNARWGWLAADECWQWSECFEGACDKEAAQPGSVSLLDGFCGDGRCDASSEDTTSCPGDCCQHENPDKCLVKNNTCTDFCCSESTCCASASSEFFTNFWVIVFSVIGGVFLLINICCCCCCYCLCRWCKGATQEKRHPTTVDRQDTTMTVLSMK